MYYNGSYTLFMKKDGDVYKSISIDSLIVDSVYIYVANEFGYYRCNCDSLSVVTLPINSKIKFKHPKSYGGRY
jgi:hypothetical protein